MKRYPIYLQDETYSCGAYCVAMILKALHIEDEIDHIKALCRLDQQGISMLGLIECLKYYHIEAKGYESDLESLTQHLKYPCILLTKDKTLLHYIVLYKYQASYFICGDPAKGLVRYTVGELTQIYQNKVIMIQVVASSPMTTRYHFFKFVIDTFKHMYPLLYKIILVSFVLSSFTLITNTYFKFIMDKMNSIMDEKMLLVVSLGVVVVLVQKAYMQRIKNNLTLTLEKHLQTNILYQTLNHLLDLPMDYKERYLASDSLNKFQTLFELPSYLIEWMESLCVDLLQILLFVFAIYYLAPRLFLEVGWILVIIVLISFLLLNKLDKKDKHLLVDMQSLMNVANHHLNASKDYLAFKLTKLEEQNKENLFNQFIMHYQDKKRWLSHYQIIVHFLLQLISVLLFYQGYKLIKLNQLTIGELMLAYSLVSYLVEPLFRFVQLGLQSKRMSLIYERYKALHLESMTGSETIIGPINTIAFDNMSFAFGYRTPIFAHQDEVFSHQLQVIGNNGSGKSTFLKLITGQLKHYRGSIKINQAELKNISEKELREKICFLNGEVLIANINVLEFLITGNELYQTKLYKLINKFQLNELIPLLSLMLDGQGQGLSQGQLQLVAFIRVILLDYEMYVFDEAFSHMSDDLKEKVKAILKCEAFKTKLILVVDHQTNIVSNNESCVIISKGSIRIGAK